MALRRLAPTVALTMIGLTGCALPAHGFEARVSTLAYSPKSPAEAVRILVTRPDGYRVFVLDQNRRCAQAGAAPGWPSFTLSASPKKRLSFAVAPLAVTSLGGAWRVHVVSGDRGSSTSQTLYVVREHGRYLVC